MDTIPNELIVQIFGYLSCSDLASLRLVSKRICDGSTPLLFENVYIYPFVESFMWLASLPMNIKAGVRRVSYVAKRLPYFATYDEWLAQPFLLKSRSPPSDNEEEEDCSKAAYKAFSRYLASQRSVLMDSFVFFSNVFQQLPRLCGLDVIVASFHVQDHKFELETRTPFTTLSLEEPGQAAYYSTSLETQVCHLLTSAHSAGCKIRNFKVNELFFEPHDDLSISTSSETIQNQFSEVFAGLSNLSLFFDTTFGAENVVWSPDKLERLVTLASLAQNLESMSIMFCPDSPGHPTVPKLLDGICFWPKLMNLELSRVATSSKDLIQLLSSHAATLRRLQLADIQLKRGTWAEVIGFMPKSLKLSRCTINGLGFSNPGLTYSHLTLSARDCCYANALHNSCFKGRVEHYIIKGGSWPECLGKVDDSVRFYNEDFGAYDPQSGELSALQMLGG